MDSEEREQARLQELDSFLRPCLQLSALDAHMDAATLFRAMDGFPEEASLTLSLYALHRERILRETIERPYDDITWENLQDAATRLSLVYLHRAGFILSFDHEDDRINWRINPLHPFRRTLEELEVASPGIHRFAQVILDGSRARLEEAKADGLSRIDLPPRAAS